MIKKSITTAAALGGIALLTSVVYRNGSGHVPVIVPKTQVSTATPAAFQAPDRGIASAPVPVGLTRAQLSTVKASSVADFKVQISELSSCYTGDCGFANTYPREYSNEVGTRLKSRLFDFANWSVETGAHGDDIALIARENLANPNGHVKEAALDLLATQDPSPANRDAILNDVIADHDDAVTPRALLELQRYDVSNSPEIHDALMQAMVTGAPYVAIAVAEGISPFINGSTYDRYEAVLTKLSTGTRPYLALQAALNQFRLKQSGA